MSERVINTDETIVLIPAHAVLGVPHAITTGGLVAYDALTSALINTYASVVATGAGAVSGGNVTCAILEDSLTLSQSDSETDDEKSLCDPGNSIDLAALNYEVSMTGFRDVTSQATPVASKAQDSVYELFRRLTFAPDVPYLAVHRIGFDSTASFAANQKIDVYYIETDWPTDVHEDGSKQKVAQSFISKSEALFDHALAA